MSDPFEQMMETQKITVACPSCGDQYHVLCGPANEVIVEPLPTRYMTPEAVGPDDGPVANAMHQILLGFQYKADWCFALEHMKSNWWMRIILFTTDSHTGAKRRPVMITHSLPIFPAAHRWPPDELTEILRSFLRERIHALEQHEADEFMLFAGKRVFDPHKE